MKMAKKVLVGFSILLILFIGLITAVGYNLSVPAYHGDRSDHFNGTTFFNPDGPKTNKGIFAILKWMTSRTPGSWNTTTQEEAPYGEKPIERSDSLIITYVNHSTFLIQVDSLNILTDPVWSQRVSPFSFAGPKRMRPPGIDFEDLPPIDAVIISHNHYDHLDIPTLERLKERFNPRIITPLGADLYLKEKGFDRSLHLEWWSTLFLTADFMVHAVPAQHFSGRGIFDRDKTLWAGYMLSTPKGDIYFAGDTGYGAFFKDIGSRFPSIKVALLPIGAYKPRWFMGPVHISPDEAVQVHKDLGAELSIGMHYGTFPLADDSEFDPENDLKKAMSLNDIDSSAFILIKEGAYIAF